MHTTYLMVSPRPSFSSQTSPTCSLPSFTSFPFLWKPIKSPLCLLLECWWLCSVALVQDTTDPRWVPDCHVHSTPRRQHSVAFFPVFAAYILSAPSSAMLSLGGWVVETDEPVGAEPSQSLILSTDWLSLCRKRLLWPRLKAPLVRSSLTTCPFSITTAAGPPTGSMIPHWMGFLSSLWYQA